MLTQKTISEFYGNFIPNCQRWEASKMPLNLGKETVTHPCRGIVISPKKQRRIRTLNRKPLCREVKVYYSGKELKACLTPQQEARVLKA